MQTVFREFAHLLVRLLTTIAALPTSSRSCWPFKRGKPSATGATATWATTAREGEKEGAVKTGVTSVQSRSLVSDFYVRSAKHVYASLFSCSPGGAGGTT